jgi:hypothetical protein
MSESRDIESALLRLDEVLRAAGVPGLEPPIDVAAIADVAEEVAPYVLPTELRLLWERIDAESVHVRTFPTIGSPATALAELRMARELAEPVPIGLPPILLPVDYASHCYGVVELGSEWAEGGSVLEFGFDDMPFVSYTVAEWIGLLAELLDEGSFELHDGWAELDHPAVLAQRLARMESSGPHPVYGDMRRIPSQLHLWPSHWLEASGIDLRSRTPLGATHTIATLMAAAADGRVTGRIHGEVTRLVGVGDGARLLVEDGTAALDVWCPAGTSPWGPVHRTRFEFEVAVDGPVRAPPDLDSPHEAATRHALAGDLASAQDAVLDLLGELDRHRPAAVATDVRPLD